MNPDILSILLDVVIFGLATGLTIMAIRGIETAMVVRRRLGVAAVQAPLATSAEVVRNANLPNRFLAWVQSATSPKDSADSTKLRRDLAAAGFDSPASSAIYVVIRFGLAIGLPVLLLVSQAFAANPMVGLPLSAATLLACGAGLIGPKGFIDNRAKTRRDQMEREFPDTLDLMVVCVEAGLGLEAAFVRVGAEVGESHPRSSDEFHRLSQEISAGRSRADALRALAQRVQVDSVKSFVALMIQTDSLGVSIGQTLRSYSIEMRETRFLRAEAKAMRIPVLLTIPLVTCILPVIIAALLLPAVIDVVRNLVPAMSGKP